MTNSAKHSKPTKQMLSRQQKSLIRIFSSVSISVTALGLGVFIAMMEMQLASYEAETRIIQVNESDNELLESTETSNSSDEILLEEKTIKQGETNNESMLPDSSKQNHGDIQKNARNIPTKIEESSKWFEQALRYSREGSLDLAIEQYNKILERKPNHQMAAINWGLSLKKLGQCELAVPKLHYALSISGGSRKGKIYALLGSCEVELGNFELAIDHFILSIEYRPGHALTWRRYAEALYLANRKIDEVSFTFDKAIALSPSNPAPILAKAQYLVASLDFDEAIKILKTYQKNSHAFDSNSIKLQKLLVWAYIESGKNQAAIKTLRWLEDFDKRYAKGIYYAQLLYLNNKYASAKKQLKKLKPSSETRYLLALCEFNLKNHENARNLLQLLDNQQLFRFRAKAKLAKIALQENDQRLALGYYKTLLNEAIYKQVVFYDTALVAARLREKDLAYNSINNALEHSPNELRLLTAKAIIDRKFGNLILAEQSLKSLSEDNPKNKSVLREWAKTLRQLDRRELALEKYHKLTQENPKIDDLFDLGKLLFEDAQYNKAVETFNSLLELNTKHIEARFYLAKSWCQIDQTGNCLQELNRTLTLNNQHIGANALKSQLKQLALQSAPQQSQ